MQNKNCKLVLWTGPKHSGKTTALQNLIIKLQKRNLKTAGLIAPSIYDGGFLLGFDLIDIKSGKRIKFARRKLASESFQFSEAGLRFGRSILNSEETKIADLIIIDEFGLLELNGGGWRKDVDSLVNSTNAIILLVVRKELIEEAKQLYKDIPCEQLSAADAQSIDKIIAMLRDGQGQ